MMIHKINDDSQVIHLCVLQMQHATSISAEEQRIAALRSGNLQENRG